MQTETEELRTNVVWGWSLDFSQYVSCLAATNIKGRFSFPTTFYSVEYTVLYNAKYLTTFFLIHEQHFQEFSLKNNLN